SARAWWRSSWSGPVQLAELDVVWPVDHHRVAVDRGGARVLEPHVHVHAGHQRGEHVGEDDGVTVLLPAAADVVAAVAAGDRAVVGELELGVLRPGPGALRRAGRLRAAAGGQQRQQARGEQGGHPADGAHVLGSPPRGPGSQTIMAHPATTRCPTTTAGTTPGAPGP